MAHFRPLSDHGKKRVGHIFDDPELIPLRQFSPATGNVDGEQQLMWLVDWNSLSDNEQERVLEFMTRRFNVDDTNEIREQFNTDGYFALQHDYIIESYDMRLVT